MLDDNFSHTNTVTLAGVVEALVAGNPARVTIATRRMSGNPADPDEAIYRFTLVTQGETARLVAARLHVGDCVTFDAHLETDPTGKLLLVADDYSINNRHDTRRASDAGDGATPFEHPSQRTIADRFDNTRQPDWGER